MEIFIYICCALWLLGAVKEIAEYEATIDKFNIELPFYGARVALALLMLFSWPFWYFYKKAR